MREPGPPIWRRWPQRYQQTDVCVPVPVCPFALVSVNESHLTSGTTAVAVIETLVLRSPVGPIARVTVCVASVV